MIQFDEHISQRAWNHQLEKFLRLQLEAATPKHLTLTSDAFLRSFIQVGVGVASK